LAKVTTKRQSYLYGFNEYRRGDAYVYLGVPFERVRNAAKMYGARHKMRFDVAETKRGARVHRTA
jgi:hypothetical protein